MSELLAAAVVFGFSLGFSQELAKDLRRWFRWYRRAYRMGPPGGSYGRQLRSAAGGRGRAPAGAEGLLPGRVLPLGLIRQPPGGMGLGNRHGRSNSRA